MDATVSTRGRRSSPVPLYRPQRGHPDRRSETKLWATRGRHTADVFTHVDIQRDSHNIVFASSLQGHAARFPPSRCRPSAPLENKTRYQAVGQM